MCGLQILTKNPFSFLAAIFLSVFPLSTRRRRPVYGKKATKRTHAGDKNKRDEKMRRNRERQGRHGDFLRVSGLMQAVCLFTCLPACLLSAAAHPSLSRLGGRFSTLLGAETQHAAGLEQSWD